MKLTEQQAIYVHLIAEGKSNKDIAKLFKLSNHQSVNNQLNGVYRFLGVETEGSWLKRRTVARRNVPGDSVYEINKIGKSLLQLRRKLEKVKVSRASN